MDHSMKSSFVQIVIAFSPMNAIPTRSIYNDIRGTVPRFLFIDHYLSQYIKVHKFQFFSILECVSSDSSMFYTEQECP